MNVNNFMNSMFGTVGEGLCRLSMNGDIAIKCTDATGHTQYKTYNIKTGNLVNCDNFVFDIGQDMFFVIPTTNVKKGDIILVNGSPRCVIEVDNNKFTVINYSDSTIETVIPERHVFMGKTYFYGKIISMFGDNSVLKSKGKNNIFKYLMISKMLGGNTSSGNKLFANDGNNFLPMMLMMNGGNGFGDMFDGIFDSLDASDDEEKSDEEDA